MTITRFKKAFPKALKLAREVKGLSQEKLSGRVGLSQSWISHFERGSRLPSALAIYNLQTELSVFDYVK